MADSLLPGTGSDTRGDLQARNRKSRVKNKKIPTIGNLVGIERQWGDALHFTCITAVAIITKPRGIHDMLIARSAHNTILGYDARIGI